MTGEKTDTHEPKTLNEVEHLMAHASIDHHTAKTARVRTVNMLLSFVSLTVLMTLPAMLIFVYASLWGWLQK